MFVYDQRWALGTMIFCITSIARYWASPRPVPDRNLTSSIPDQFQSGPKLVPDQFQIGPRPSPDQFRDQPSASSIPCPAWDT